MWLASGRAEIWTQAAISRGTKLPLVFFPLFSKFQKVAGIESYPVTRFCEATPAAWWSLAISPVKTSLWLPHRASLELHPHSLAGHAFSAGCPREGPLLTIAGAVPLQAVDLTR